MLDGVVIDDTELLNDKLREWEDLYNFHRPHRAFGGQTPYIRPPIARSACTFRRPRFEPFPPHAVDARNLASTHGCRYGRSA
jgi:hypothetical protein